MSPFSAGGGEFTTADGPTATTGEASEITASEAKVGGTVDPTGSDTSYHIEWHKHGLRPFLAGTCRLGQLQRGGIPKLTGLHPDTTYHYRVSAEKAASTPVAGSSTASPRPRRPRKSLPAGLVR